MSEFTTHTGNPGLANLILSSHRRPPTMYDLQLDLNMYFCPPMEETGHGIRLTRAIQIPFPPYEGLAISSSDLDAHPMPEGFVLKAVVWDADRTRFTAETTMVFQDFSFGEIADEIACWEAIGWKFGSFADDFEEDTFDENEEEPLDESAAVPIEYEESLVTKPSRQRPKSFNKLFRAMIRTMAELYNATPTAYAMWKTKLYFSEKQLKENQSKPASRFRDAQHEYARMSFDEQYDWRERVSRTYPRLDRVVRESTRDR